MIFVNTAMCSYGYEHFQIEEEFQRSPASPDFHVTLMSQIERVKCNYPLINQYAHLLLYVESF